MPGWTDPKTTKVQAVLAEIFLFVNAHLQIVKPGFVYINYLRIIPVITDGCNDRVESFFCAISEMDGLAFSKIDVVKYSYMPFAYVLECANI
ncbi:MAG: hypothetical protein E6H10_10030 [Bacteroidetes bacterium]|nr:MAG: hypothetical protein E6H10_10030 [Bacteroidota bacterium]